MSRQPLASRSAVLQKIGAAIPPSGDAARDRSIVSARIAGTLTSLADLSGGTQDELVSSRTNARRNVVRFHYQGCYGGGRGRPARTRGNAEAARPESAHSITSSASASNLSGISRPRTLAALRLMTNSNFTDCITGKSAGFSPWRILPAYTPP
jgi:hypothetical protein